MACIVQLCLSGNCGGMEIYVERISQALARRGHRVHVLTAAGTYLAHRVPASINHSVGVEGKRDLPRLTIEIPSEITKRRPEAIHVHGGLELPYAVLTKLRCRYSFRLIYSRHINISRPKKDLWHRFLYQRVDAYLAISERIQAEARRYVPIPPERVHLLHHGVEFSNDGPSDRIAARKRLGVQPESFVVATFSRIEHAKGHHTLIEAMGLLLQRGITLATCIVGHVTELEYGNSLKSRVRDLKLGAHVAFLDFVPDVCLLMSACDIVVVPSSREGFGLVAAEAMAAGVAVVATRDGGGILDIIEHNSHALLFNWGDAAMLARHLETLYRNAQLRARLAHNGQNLVRRQFGMEAHMDALEAHLLGQPIPGTGLSQGRQLGSSS